MTLFRNRAFGCALAAGLAALSLGSKAAAEDVVGVPDRLVALNSALAAQDWSGHYPFWFVADDSAPYLGVVALRTVVQAQDGSLLIVFADDTETFEAGRPIIERPTTEAPVSSARTVEVMRMAADKVSVSEVRALAVRRLGPAGVSLEDLRAEPGTLDYVELEVFEVLVTCADDADCIEAVAATSTVRDDVAGADEPSTYETPGVSLISPSRAEAEALREALVELLATMNAP